MGVIDDILAKDPEVRTVEFCTDRSLREKLATAQFDLDQAKRRRDRLHRTDKDRAGEVDREITDLEDTVEQLSDEVRDHGLIRFTFQALPPGEYDALKAQHRPTEPQKSKARKANEPAPDFNTDTFPPVLIAAACTLIESPSGTVEGLSVEDAERIWNASTYNDAERNELFNAAFGAQLTRTRADLPKGA